MSSNLDRYKKDFERLLRDSVLIGQSFARLCYGEEYDSVVLTHCNGDKDAAKIHMDSLPNFTNSYQSWYSECLVLIKQLLPDRLNDFIRLYEKPKGRKDIGFENYRIEDALQGLRITRYGDEIVADRKSAMPHLDQQIAILKSIEKRFESSLYDIRQLVQADLFDSELDAARELLKHKFMRAAGAISGVVLEKHLHEVCVAHNIKLTKKHPTIADLNDALKNAAVIETAQWRFHQHLGDIRNLCDHSKKAEPTVDQVTGLIEGVAKVTKTVF